MAHTVSESCIKAANRIAAVRSKTLIAGLCEVFREFERPDCVKIDNAAIMIGTLRA